MDRTQKCKKCGDSHPLTARYWHKSDSHRSGLSTTCKACASAYLQERRGKPILSREQFWADLEKAERVLTLREHGLRECSSCGQVKPLEDYYGKGDKGKISQCKPCYSQVKKAEYQLNKDELKAKSNARYKSNRDSISRRRRQLYRENRESMVAVAREYRERNREKTREWAKTNYAKRKCAQGDYGDIEVQALLVYQEGYCAACGKDLDSGFHVDHILPISRGGDNSIRNLQILCPGCNQSKHARLLDEFLEDIGGVYEEQE